MNLDMADIRPSVMNWAIAGIMAVTFIVLMKYVTTKYPVPGLSQFMAAV